MLEPQLSPGEATPGAPVPGGPRGRLPPVLRLCRVLPQGDETPDALNQARLALCEATRQVIVNGLPISRRLRSGADVMAHHGPQARGRATPGDTPLHDPRRDPGSSPRKCGRATRSAPRWPWSSIAGRDGDRPGGPSSAPRCSSSTRTTSARAAARSPRRSAEASTCTTRPRRSCASRSPAGSVQPKACRWTWQRRRAGRGAARRLSGRANHLPRQQQVSSPSWRSP